MTKIILLGVCLSGCSFSNIQTNIANTSKLEAYRFETLSEIKIHSQKHQECILNNLYSTVERMPIEWLNGDLHTAAYAHNGKVFINRNMGISVKDGVVTVLHEAIHVNNICGEDVVKTEIPICYLFDKPVYYSTDITNHIQEHLKEFK